mmetsp:Transcript_8170/g.24593  ORF Transcript_8170/g.24593 Transcript_8170/m.24593 type:complete len:175 (-) Transcript_8170:21-545(-)
MATRLCFAVLAACLVVSAHAKTALEQTVADTCDEGCFSEMSIRSSGYGEGMTNNDAWQACEEDCAAITVNGEARDSARIACLELCGIQARFAPGPETCTLCPTSASTVRDCETEVELAVIACERRCRGNTLKDGSDYISFASRQTTTDIRYEGDRSQCKDDDDGDDDDDDDDGK